MIKKSVIKTESGIKIKFVWDIKKNNISSMITSCKTGKCWCNCNPITFKKIENMSVSGEDGNVTISLKGNNLTKNEIEKAVWSCNLR